jgi:hypothetical protein
MSSKSEILARIESLFFDRTFSDLSMEEIAVELGMKKPRSTTTSRARKR